MKVFRPIKRALRWYFQLSAQNYAWMWTGCVWKGEEPKKD